MDAAVTFRLDNEQQFWDELEDLVSAQCETDGHIDNALRSYLAITTNFQQQYLHSEHEIARCCYKLLDSPLFQAHNEYVRRQLVYCLLQEDDAVTLHLAAAFLLYDGRTNEATFEMMQRDSVFPRLVSLINDKIDDRLGLHRLALELLYEMSRIQKLSREDLATVDDTCILYLFQMIEQLSDDADDPYHYPIIRVLLVLNEQYMCVAQTRLSTDEPEVRPLTNRILKLLSAHGPSYRTFGENLILLLNREASLGPQLLILKLLYLLFTTPPTYEYFYTNDLHVLVDVIIRNLLDLDPGNDDVPLGEDGFEGGGQRALRHTYLRVLCPLLRNTQLARQHNNYKREEVRKMLYILVNRSSAHFAPVDETVIRLVIRCKQIEWLRDDTEFSELEGGRWLPDSTPTDGDLAKTLLGMTLNQAGESSLSVVEVAAKVAKERPSVPAPRRRRKKANGVTAQPNWSHGNELKVPPRDVETLNPGIGNEGGKSPFADDNEEVSPV